MDQVTLFTRERKERIGGSRRERVIFHKIRTLNPKIST